MLAPLKKSLIRLLERRGYCVSFGEPATFDSILSAFESRVDQFYFVQIGAYDGKESDPIHNFIRNHHWHGLLVEPQPDAFAELRKNYAGVPGLVFENVAIAAQEGPLPFYRLKDEFAPLFHADSRTLSSFNPEHILRHLSKPVEAAQALDKIEVPCLTLSGLLKKHDVTHVDLLQIDAEGHDFQIIKLIDFATIVPRIIHFEHANLSPEERNECFDLLLSKSYRLSVNAYDVTAFQSRVMYD